MEIVQRIDAALRAAGVPVAGVCDNGDGTFRVDYLPSATDAQKAAGAAIVQSTPKRKRAPLPAATLRTQLAALSAADRDTLVVAMLAEFLRTKPGVARTLGVAIDGDQDSA